MKWIPFLFALACSGAKTDDAEVDEPTEPTTEEPANEAADEPSNEASDEPDNEPADGMVFINEVLAKSDVTADWIELYNGGDTAIDLSGYALYDGDAADEAWVIPDATEIAAGGFLIVWADDMDEDSLGDTQGDVTSSLHASFKLSKDGEMLTLLDASGATVDSVEFPALADEESYARTEDGGLDWSVVDIATPGASNN
ncbi:MAG: lamin tail domain-containing protein [Myxococcota bacterium]|nr:lamin tail domain-containing protein [Myxococcota bacterium]